MNFFRHSRFALIALLLVLATLFASCNLVLPPELTAPQTTTPNAPETTTPSGSGSQQVPAGPFDYNNVPAYSDKLYVEINNNIPFFDEDDYTTKSYETYSALDSLGRCGVAMACIGRWCRDRLWCLR